MLVQGWSEHRLSGIFLVDFGTNDLLISYATVKKIGLIQKQDFNTDGSVTMSSIDGKPVHSVTMNQFQIGTLDLLKPEFVIVDDKRMPVISGKRIDGIIGAVLLQAYAIKVDFQRHLIAIVDHTGLSDEELASLGMAGTQFVDMDVTPQGLLTVPVTLQGPASSVTHQIMVDPGDGESAISREDANKLGLLGRFKTTRYSPSTGGVTYNFDVLSGLQLGTEPIPNQSVYFLDHDSPRDVPAHIGIDVLSHYIVLFDYGRKRLYLKPVAVKSAPPLIRTQQEETK